MGTWTLEHLRHMGAWVLKALRHLSTGALEGHLGTWGTYLAGSFRQLLHIYLNNWEYGIEHDTDSAYEVYIHYRHSEVYSRFNKYFAI